MKLQESIFNEICEKRKLYVFILRAPHFLFLFEKRSRDLKVFALMYPQSIYWFQIQEIQITKQQNQTFLCKSRTLFFFIPKIGLVCSRSSLISGYQTEFILIISVNLFIHLNCWSMARCEQCSSGSVQWFGDRLQPRVSYINCLISVHIK